MSASIGGDVAAKLFNEGILNDITTSCLLSQPTHLGWIASESSTKSRSQIKNVTSDKPGPVKRPMVHQKAEYQHFAAMPDGVNDTVSDSTMCCSRGIISRHSPWRH